MSKQCFTINNSEVSYNFFDDEIIVINLQTGMYFSLHNSAAALWRVLQQGSATVESAAAVFDAATPEVAAGVREFFAKLQAERLIIEAAAAETPSAVPTQKSAYSPPALEAFDDLQALLLADIIHDTDENGWPNLTDNQGDVAGRAA